MALGLAVFVAGTYLLFFEAGLEKWIAIGILTAGIIMFVGLLLMGFASGAPRDAPATREVHDREIVRDREVVREPEPVQERVVHHYRD